MILRLALVGVLTLVACGDRKAAPQVRKSPLETAIARELTAKLGVPVTATCDVVSIVATCEASAKDLKLPIEVISEGGEWAWRVKGRVLETAPIAAYVDSALTDIKLGQTANCGARVIYVAPGERLGCKLSGGGMAFVAFSNDGTVSLELDVDPASGSARGELVTPERDRELTAISKALEALEGESDGEEEIVSDGGVPQP